MTRENYIYQKPHSECYELAKKLYYKNEGCVIGIENTLIGYKSIKKITECLYMVTNKHHYDYNKLLKQDVYLIDDFLEIFS